MLVLISDTLFINILVMNTAFCQYLKTEPHPGEDIHGPVKDVWEVWSCDVEESDPQVDVIKKKFSQTLT